MKKIVIVIKIVEYFFKSLVKLKFNSKYLMIKGKTSYSYLLGFLFSSVHLLKHN